MGKLPDHTTSKDTTMIPGICLTLPPPPFQYDLSFDFPSLVPLIDATLECPAQFDRTKHSPSSLRLHSSGAVCVRRLSALGHSVGLFCVDRTSYTASAEVRGSPGANHCSSAASRANLPPARRAINQPARAGEGRVSEAAEHQSEHHRAPIGG